MPSERLGIDNEIAAIDFDLACSYRLTQWDLEWDIRRRKDEAQLTNLAIRLALSDKEFEFKDD